MKKAPDAFRTISEVAEWLDVQAHVLRFWESKFTQVKPVKRAGGRRYYRPADMRLIGGIKTLLYDEGMTIKGVQKILREKGVDYVTSLSGPVEDEAADPAAPPADVAAQTPPTEGTTEPSPAQDTAPEAAPDAQTEAADPSHPAPASDNPQPDAVDDAPAPVTPVPETPGDAAPDDADAPATEPASEEAAVVSFQSRKHRADTQDAAPEEPAAPAGDVPEPDPALAAPAPVTAPSAEPPVANTAEAEPPAADPAAPEESPEPNAPDGSPDSPLDDAPEDDLTESAKPAAPEKPHKRTRRPEAERDLFEDLPDQPNIPAFLHRPAMGEPDPDPDPVAAPPAPAPDAAPMRARAVQADDPPADDDIDAAPGCLGKLAAMEQLPVDGLEDLKALAEDLRARHTSQTDPSA